MTVWKTRRPPSAIAVFIGFLLCSVLLSSNVVHAQSEEPTRPAGCGTDASNAATWFDSVASTSSTVTITLVDPLPASGSIAIQLCFQRTTPPISWVVNQVSSFPTPTAGSTFTISKTGSSSQSPALLAETDYWVRVSEQSYSNNYGFWKYIKTKAEGTDTPNSPATGAPTISGFEQVGQTLTAATSGISDSDGLTSPTYSYQWIRVGTDLSETDISSANSSTYTLAAAELGKKVRVKVSFQDDDGNAEELFSMPTLTVVAKAPVCTSGNVWCATLTVGASTKGGTGAGNGYCSSVTNACTTSYGSLSDTEFHAGRHDV